MTLVGRMHQCQRLRLRIITAALDFLNHGFYFPAFRYCVNRCVLMWCVIPSLQCIYGDAVTSDCTYVHNKKPAQFLLKVVCLGT